MISYKKYVYKDFITLENIFNAWIEFRKGKRGKEDVQLFERNLEDNIFQLYFELKNKTYRHSSYQSFYVNDPKQRHIHKASIRDRVIHHLLYKYLYEAFDKSFIYDSYSCRLEKGTHKAIFRLEKLTRKISRNYIKPCWIVKCDVKKFFASIDHEILITLLKTKMCDVSILRLLKEVVYSFTANGEKGKGIPLGNLTSQVFANIYLNEFDQFIKHTLKIKYYLRYADDFLIISNRKEELEAYLKPISNFLEEKLKLELHPKKIIFRNLYWGIDFLGYVILPHYILPRTKTKRRIFKKIEKTIHSFKKEEIPFETLHQSVQSYLGYLSHANTYKLTNYLKNQIWFWLTQ